ncbi:TPA: hypothetical protein U0K67_001225 [Streptococcus suis]|nr:hypothetical protein [Streptococcus suis]
MVLHQEELERKIDISAKISDYVYNYEKAYTKAMKDSNPDTNPIDEGNEAIADDLAADGLTLSHAQYDPSTGVAAIAVYDSQTDETYIAYAGTNFEADGLKDAESDAAIALNDSLSNNEK